MNQGAGTQVTAAYGTVTVTVIISPADAVSGFGETATSTPATLAPSAKSADAAFAEASVPDKVTAVRAPARDELVKIC